LLLRYPNPNPRRKRGKERMTISMAELKDVTPQFIAMIRNKPAVVDELKQELAPNKIDSILAAMDEFLQQLFAIQTVGLAGFAFSQDGGLSLIICVEDKEEYLQAMRTLAEFTEKIPVLLRPSPWVWTRDPTEQLSLEAVALRLKNTWESPLGLDLVDLVKGMSPDLKDLTDEETVTAWNDESPPPQITHIVLFKRNDNDIETKLYSYS